jgi:hypothetical protein
MVNRPSYVTVYMLDPSVSPEALGELPWFLEEEDPRPAREQFDDRYVAGWMPMPGFRLNKRNGHLTYPGDPPMRPFALMHLHRDEVIVFYPYAFVMIMKRDGKQDTFEVARMD